MFDLVKAADSYWVFECDSPWIGIQSAKSLVLFTQWHVFKMLKRYPLYWSFCSFDLFKRSTAAHRLQSKTKDSFLNMMKPEVLRLIADDLLSASIAYRFSEALRILPFFVGRSLLIYEALLGCKHLTDNVNQGY